MVMVRCPAPAGGLALHAVHWPGAGPAAVLVHGMVVAGRSMAPLAQALNRRDVAVWVPDLPGFGASQRSRRALSVDQLADAVAGWARAAGLVGSTFVGNSFGTQVVAALAARHPGIAGRVALVAPTIDARWRWGPAYRWLARRPDPAPAERPEQPGPVTRRVRRLLLPTAADPPAGPSLGALILSEYALAGPRRVIATYREAMADRIEDRLGAVDVPVLVVRGSDDNLCSAPWVRRLAGLAAHSSWAEVAGADHDAAYHHPGAVAGALAPWLTAG